MKLISELINDITKDYSGYTSGHSGNIKKSTVHGPKKYYIKGKNLKNEEKKWGPFDSTSDAREFMKNSKNIRFGQVVFESLRNEPLNSMNNRAESYILVREGHVIMTNGKTSFKTREEALNAKNNMADNRNVTIKLKNN